MTAIAPPNQDLLAALGREIPADRIVVDPAVIDGLSADQQQEAVSKAIQSALGDLDTEIEKLDDATEKEVRDALKGTPTP